jgi:hypothetical protein
MRRIALVFLVSAGLTLAALFVARLAPSSGSASSHREAPLISEDPSADNTDLYAFRSPDRPSTLTIVANWIPGEDPAAGPNYYTFSQRDDAKYLIYVDRNGDGKPDVTWNFQFHTPTGPYFLGNTEQRWVAKRNGVVFASGKTPIDNVGPRFNSFVGVKNYEQSAEKTIVTKDGVSIFAGQRDDPFFADVGAIFDLVAIRKAGTTGNMGGGKDFLSGYNVHTIALQIPISQVDTKSHVIGVWAATNRKNVTVDGHLYRAWVQIWRLGNPLVNEVVIPTGEKDLWNRTTPQHDEQFEKYYETPILAAVLNKLYKLGVPETNRDDLVAVLGTGIPKLTYTGPSFADELRLDLSVPGVRAPEPDGRPRRRQRRLPERPPARRRRRRHRGAGGRRLPRGEEGAARRRRERQRRAVPRALPVRGPAARGVREHEGDPLTHPPSRGLPCGAGPGTTP